MGGGYGFDSVLEIGYLIKIINMSIDIECIFFFEFDGN